MGVRCDESRVALVSFLLRPLHPMSLESLSNDKFVQPLSSAEKQILTGGAMLDTTGTAGITFPIPDGEIDVDW